MHQFLVLEKEKKKKNKFQRSKCKTPLYTQTCLTTGLLVLLVL